MKAFLMTALVSTSVAMSMPAAAQQTEVTDAAMLTQLDEHNKKWAAAFNSNDAAAIAALYTEDGVEITNQGPIYGREALQKHYETLLKTFKFSEHAGKRHRSYMIDVDANVVLSHGEYTFTASDNKGNSMPLTGYWSSVSVLEDGVWRDKMQTWNVAQSSGTDSTPDTVATQN